MPEPKTFGRRGVAPPQAAQIAATMAFSPEAEAFRAALARDARTSTDFALWRRSARGQGLMIWGLTLAFMTSGALSFTFDAPLPLSIGLEVAGLFVNGWLRRARRQRLRDIVAWEEPED